MAVEPLTCECIRLLGDVQRLEKLKWGVGGGTQGCMPASLRVVATEVQEGIGEEVVAVM